MYLSLYSYPTIYQQKVNFQRWFTSMAGVGRGLVSVSMDIPGLSIQSSFIYICVCYRCICKYFRIKICLNQVWTKPSVFQFGFTNNVSIYTMFDCGSSCLYKPVLSNEGQFSCLMKQREPLTGFELTPERHSPITSNHLPLATVL